VYHDEVPHDDLADAVLRVGVLSKTALEGSHEACVVLIAHVKDASKRIILASHPIDEVCGKPPRGVGVHAFLLAQRALREQRGHLGRRQDVDEVGLLLKETNTRRHIRS